MSSSDKFPDWNLFTEREVPLEVEMLSPAVELAAVLQACRADLDASRHETQEVRGKGLLHLAEQAVFVVQMEGALARYEPDFAKASLQKVYRHFRILKDQMLDALRYAGLELEVPLGRSFKEVADTVNVDGWRHHESYRAEIVAEVLEPIVRCNGTVVRPGRVVMGAPPQTSVADDTVADRIVEPSERSEGDASHQ